MTRYIELHPPLNLIDGVPSSIAGEWPGIKSNKFQKTKKIIHIKDSNIFSLDEFFYPKTKKMFMHNQKEEIPIKEKKRRVLSAITINKIKSKTIHNDLFPTPLQNYNRLVINREYDFEKRAKYYKMIQSNHDKKMKENEIINKNKNSNIGLNIKGNNQVKKFNKQFYENVSSNKNLGVTLNQKLYRKYQNKYEKMKKNNFGIINKRKINSYKYLNDNKKNLEIKKEQELKYDIDYVLSLDEIEYKAKNRHIQNKNS